MNIYYAPGTNSHPWHGSIHSISTTNLWINLIGIPFHGWGNRDTEHWTTTQGFKVEVESRPRQFDFRGYTLKYCARVAHLTKRYMKVYTSTMIFNSPRILHILFLLPGPVLQGLMRMEEPPTAFSEPAENINCYHGCLPHNDGPFSGNCSNMQGTKPEPS